MKGTVAKSQKILWRWSRYVLDIEPEIFVVRVQDEYDGIEEEWELPIAILPLDRQASLKPGQCFRLALRHDRKNKFHFDWLPGLTAEQIAEAEAKAERMAKAIQWQ